MTEPKTASGVSKEQALQALSFIEDIWEMAPDLPYTKTLRRFIEQSAAPEAVVPRIDADKLRREIKNLPTRGPRGTIHTSDYLAGHRDARHAAAELVSAAADRGVAPTPVPLAELRRLIADDAYAATFQTFGQYRTALLKAIDASGVDLPVGPRNGLARIEGDAIVIRLTADACAFAFANDPHAQEPRPPVIDKQGFLRDTFHALTNEREDGSTPLTDVLDRAMVKAMEDGSDALDHDAPGVDSTRGGQR